jgi:DNA-binding transcriptional MerR regulator
MTLSHGPLWTLDELSAEVALALAVDYSGQANGRVRDVPDMRTIRYYTTLGLIDRPVQMRGRTALYGERHLLQLVAIKRLQARGLSLAEIQARVVGQTEAGLRKLAQMPASRPETAKAERSAAEQQATEPRRDAFWTEEAASPVEGETVTRPAEEGRKPNGRDVLSLVGVPLDEGVTLLLEAGRSLDELDVEALRTAAAPLVKLLEARRLVGERGKRTQYPLEEHHMSVTVTSDELRQCARKLQGQQLYTLAQRSPFHVEKVEGDSIFYGPRDSRSPEHEGWTQEVICQAFNKTRSLTRSVVLKAMAKEGKTHQWRLSHDLALIACILADRVRQGQTLGLPGVSDEEICTLADRVRGRG